MANKKISQLTTASTIADADAMAIVQSNQTKKTLFSVIAETIRKISGLTEKATVTGNDIFLLNDSAASDAPKKVKYTTIKSDIQNINALTDKASPTTSDLLIINDAAAGNAPKKIEIGNLPAAAGVYEFEGDTAGSVKVTLATKQATQAFPGTSAAAYTEFKVKKPVEVYFQVVFGANANANANGFLQVYQNGDWRTVFINLNAAAAGTSNTFIQGFKINGVAATTSAIYGATLNPGKYRVGAVAATAGAATTTDTTVVATGVWDGELTTGSILES
jgi:hypothetical protein